MNKAQKPLKIAQITNLWESVPPKHKGGLEQLVYYLCEGLHARGHQVTLFGTEDSRISGNLHPVWPKAVSTDPHSQPKDRSMYATWSVSEALHHAQDFDILHDHTFFTMGHFAGLVHTPVVSTLHHSIDESSNFVQSFPPYYQEKYLLDQQHKHYSEMQMVTVSHHQKEKLQKDLNHNATVIHNGIPLSEWKNYSTTPGKYFAYLGYITGFKGVDKAIQAILPTGKKLQIAGPVDHEDQASQYFFDNKVKPYLDKDIKYLGALDNQEKKDFLRNAKATLMPVQWDEPFGLVAIESLAVGTPVIANNRGALPEIIVNGESGFLVESVEEMTVRIAEIDKIDRAACRRRYEENFTAEKMVKEYEKLYYKLINRQVTTKPSQ